MTTGATRYRHYLRHMALVTMLGRPPQYALGLGGDRRRSLDGALDELTRRRRRAQIAARRALQI